MLDLDFCGVGGTIRLNKKEVSLMDTYYGVIYFKDGTKRETGGFSGPGAEQSCERHTRQQFDQYMRQSINPRFEPSRYEVRKR